MAGENAMVPVQTDEPRAPGDEGGFLERSRASGERAMAAAAARARAEVEAAYTVALHRPRNLQQVRVTLKARCQDPEFAASARYRRPVGRKKLESGQWVTEYAEGPSIRFAELALAAMTNIRASVEVVFEDAEARTIRVSVLDLETNVAYAGEMTLAKRVERRTPRQGQIVISERLTSQNQKVYLVQADEGEMRTKTMAEVSRILRTCGLRLVPQDIINDAMREAVSTITRQISADPAKRVKNLVDFFFGKLGVGPVELEKYVGHPLPQLTDQEYADMRALAQSILDGETTWAASMEAALGEKRADAEQGAIDAAAITAGQAPTRKADGAQPAAPAVPVAPEAPAPTAPTPPPPVTEGPEIKTTLKPTGVRQVKQPAGPMTYKLLAGEIVLATDSKDAASAWQKAVLSGGTVTLTYAERSDKTLRLVRLGE
jgi:hypothetical protein